MLTLLSLTALALATPDLACAQIVGGRREKIWQFDGTGDFDEFGYSVAGAGDVDGDGFDDVIVGIPGADPGGLIDAGSIVVYSGIDGRVIWMIDGNQGGSEFGRAVAGAGDVDADGCDDLIVGAFLADNSNLVDAGAAVVFSGRTGRLIWRTDGFANSDYHGYSVASAGDVNADGFGDFVVGTRNHNRRGLATVYSGSDFSVLMEFHGSGINDYLGTSVAGAGDVNLDGYDDVIVGAQGADPFGRDGAGSAFVYSGLNGAVILQFHGVDASDSFGASVAGAGDVDHDGVPDLIVGAPHANIDLWTEVGAAYVFSGTDGRMLLSFLGKGESGHFGSSVAGAGDVDGDLHDDLIVGAELGRREILIVGNASVYSGFDGSRTWHFRGEQWSDLLGVSVSGAGDVDRDGFDDVIIGATGTDPNSLINAGSAFVHGLDTFLHLDVDELSLGSGVPVHLDLDYPESEAGFFYAVLASASGVGPLAINGIEIPLTLDRLMRAGMNGWFPPVADGFLGRLDGQGNATASLMGDSRLAPFLGRTIHLAAVSFGRRGMVILTRLSSTAWPLTLVP